MTPRYHLTEVFTRGGRRIAKIRDTRAGRDLFIYLRDNRYRHWDLMDRPVEDRKLAQLANRALTVPSSPQMSLDGGRALEGAGA